MTTDYDARFGGIARLYGRAAQERLRRGHVCVVGVGGVGSWAVEALARTGVGRLTLIDLDDVCVSNANRQLHALDGHIGQAKVEVLADRAKRINPEIALTLHPRFFTASHADALLAQDYDCVLDAIDDVENKCLLLAACRARGLAVVTVGGAGGRRDPSKITSGDLNRSRNDGLLRRVRRELKQAHGFPEAGDWGIPCVFSDERPVYPTPDGETCLKPHAGEAPQKLDCAAGFGAATFVTGTFGFHAAALVVERLTTPALPA
jgi:tRNA A37 threonylcarbamoyladenosine dehydratase